MKPIVAGLLAVGLLVFQGQADPGPAWRVVDDGGDRLVEAPEEAAAWEAQSGWRVIAAPAGSGDPKERQVSLSPDRHPVFYLAGEESSVLTRRLLTGKLSVRLRGMGWSEAELDKIAATVAADHGLHDAGEAEAAAPWRLMRAMPPARALECVLSLRADARVAEAEVVWARQMVPRDFPNDPLFPHQWHVANVLPTVSGEAPVDLSVLPIWGEFGKGGTRGWRGRGVRIGILDDGIDYAHPEFGDGRLDTAAGRNWNGGGSGNAGAQNAVDRHGTAVAGLAAATAHNAVGVAGVAPEAGLVSLRLTAGAHDDEDEAQAIGFLANARTGLSPVARLDIKNASWGPADGAFRLSGPGPLARQALATAAREGRNGRGTIFVWAVGNGGAMGEDANSDGYANNPHVIAVGAIDALGRVPAYSEGGACLAVVAPSGTEAALPLVTTDRPGRLGFNPPNSGTDLPDHAYTEGFSGTSAAAPQVAGVVALMLEANPALGWRDVKEILLRSARRVNRTSPAWITNAVGLRFHPRQGAGLVDAAAAVALAVGWSPLGPQVEMRASAIQPGAITDDSEAGLTRTFMVGQRRRVEHALVRFSASHPYRGDLRITLTSPGGTTSELAPSYFATLPTGQSNYNDWVFSSLHFWGENSAGAWTLKVMDVLPDESGRFLGAELTLLATDILPLPVITSPAARTTPVGQPFEHVVAIANGPAALVTVDPLPAGMEFDAITGTLRGRPSKTGNFRIIIRATTATGITSQEFELTVVGGYAAWLAAQGVPEDAGAPTQDADLDGRLNIFEYAEGGDPMSPDPPEAGECATHPEGDLGVRFVRRTGRTDLLWQLEFSGDGVAWTAVAESRDGQPAISFQDGRFAIAETPELGDLVAVTASLVERPVPSQGWFRVRVSLAP
ncbi:MAG: S8 family serine peptidase [Verrucomicrobiales bacterium]